MITSVHPYSRVKRFSRRSNLPPFEPNTDSHIIPIWENPILVGILTSPFSYHISIFLILWCPPSPISSSQIKHFRNLWWPNSPFLSYHFSIILHLVWLLPKTCPHKSHFILIWYDSFQKPVPTNRTLSPFGMTLSKNLSPQIALYPHLVWKLSLRLQPAWPPSPQHKKRGPSHSPLITNCSQSGS